MKFRIEEIESCQKIGDYIDEYVYDVEVNHPSHTFISDDILVHNSIFVSFNPAIKNSDWRNKRLREINDITETFILLESKTKTSVNNQFMLDYFKIEGVKLEDSDIELLKSSIIKNKPKLLIIDGCYVKDWKFNADRFQDFLNEYGVSVQWNWVDELDYIQGIDFFRYAGYFKKKLDEYAQSYGVVNRQDFELERICESIINIAKKKYIQHIVYEDGLNYDRLKYLFPKGVELIRSSTPAFARENIITIVHYLFEHPDTFNIKDLIDLIKELRRKFEIADPDDISMQSSVSSYGEKVINDRDKLEFVNGAHFAVKASAYYNYLLNKNKDLQTKYEFIKSGTKIKYYYVKDTGVNDIFAYIRGYHPIEFAPEIDYDIQFFKSIISPINSIIKPLGLPEITKRLRAVVDIFGGFF